MAGSAHELPANEVEGGAVRLATIRHGGGTRAVRVDVGEAVEIDVDDVGELLRRPDWREVARTADGRRHEGRLLDYAPLVPRPDKIICVGLNYRSHILETGRDLPSHPTLFAKYSSALVGARDDIVLPAASDQVDWEAELAVVIGAPVRHADADGAVAAIAGYAVLNDVSVRDFQYRTAQWLQGKTFESSTPFGPWLVTADESPGPSREIRCEVNGELVQKADTSDLLFGPAALVSYVSGILTLEPGDVISTGTPAGIGAARRPPRFLNDGDEVVTHIGGVGECRNTCRRERR
jgi:acylpyruvate hydrolase